MLLLQHSNTPVLQYSNTLSGLYMTPPIYFRPAIPLLVSLIFGIILGSEYSGFESGAGVVALFSLVCVLHHLYRRRTGIIFPLLLFLALGYLSIAPWLRPGFPPNHVTRYAGSARWDITGTIDGRPRAYNNRTRFVLRIVSLADNHQVYPVAGKLRVTAVGQIPPIAAGDKLRLNSRIRLISNFNNPGGFDYQRHMAFKGIWATAYVKAEHLAVLKRNRPAGVFGIIGGARRSFSDLVEQFGEPDSRSVLNALIIGERGQISAELRQAFNRTGAGHLLAISGLHIGIVATVAFAFIRFLTSRILPLLWRAWSRKCAALLSLLPVFVYGMIAGFSPSTQRAVIMVAIFLFTFLFESEQDPLNTLALAALVILLIDPPSLFSISFQLSFTAVLGIIYGLSRLRYAATHQPSGAKSRPMRLKTITLTFFLVSCLAICGSLPLVAYYFNQISLIGIVANFILVPLIGFIAVPLGLAALSILPFSMTLAARLIEADLVILSFALELVRFFAELPFAAFKIVTPSLLEIACFYALGWSLLNLGRSDSNRIENPSMPDGAGGRCISAGDSPPPGICIGLLRRFIIGLVARGHFPLRSSARAKILLGLTLLILAADVGYWMYQRFWHPDLRVTVIDVGHGSAALVELPGGHTVLVDGGGFSDNSTFDVGERIIAPLLWYKKINTVDTMILSHPNSDHLNGLIYILRNFKVRRVWTNNEAYPTKGYRRFADVIAHRQIPLETIDRMKRHQRIDDTELELLYPPTNFLKLRHTQKWRNINNNSLVVKISLNSVSFLFPGDIMSKAERELLSLADGNLDSTVLIAPHHGSRTSSSPQFIDAVSPEVTVVSAGRSSRFRLPHPTVLKRYRARGCLIFQTALNGAVQFNTDGRSLDIKPFIEVAATCVSSAN